MSKRLVLAVVSLAALGLAMAILGFKLGTRKAESRQEVAGSLEAPPEDPSDLRQDWEDSDELPRSLTLRHADYYGLTPEEFHRVRLASLTLGATPKGEGPQPYPGFKFVTLRWRKDFEAQAAAHGAREVFALLLQQRILTEALPIIELEHFPLPMCDQGLCLRDGPFRWRVLIPVMPETTKVEPPLVLGTFPNGSVAALVDTQLNHQSFADLERLTASHAPNRQAHHLLFRMKDRQLQDWGDSGDPLVDVILPIP